MSTLPMGNRDIRLAMFGMVDGNGHPYSWSAIVNGYDREAMAACPFAGIPAYLFREPAESFGIPGVKVTHIHTQNRIEAEHIARASKIDHVLDKPEDAIGRVDAVVVATDIGSEHVSRCRLFIEAGIPVFVDKPLVDNEADLRIFVEWERSGAAILSSSSARYTKEYMPYRASIRDLGALRYATVAMAKSWERYGIHALEGVFTVIGPGFVSARNTGFYDRNIVHLEHECGADVVLAVTGDMYGGFGSMLLVGTESSVLVKANDTFYSFKAQLESFVSYLRTGARPFPFADTIELMKIIIAGIRSREEGGRRVKLSEIVPEIGI